MSNSRFGGSIRLAAVFAAGLACCCAQSGAGTPAASGNLRSTYVIGPDDQIIVHALHVADITDKPLRVDMSGYVRVPLAGRLHASGMTVEQLENEISAKLKEYVREPEVTVTVAEFKSQPVSVMGAVKSPGVYQVQGRKTLIEVLSSSGGLEPDAGDRVRITRAKAWGGIDIPGAHSDPTGEFTVAEVNLKQLMEARNPAQNILVRPHDVITVPRADLVYVLGDVHKPGGFTLRDKEQVTVLQALSMSEGLLRTAGGKHARILRADASETHRKEIPVNVNRILSGQSPDVPMQPDDILFVPNSAPKSAAMRGLEAAVQAGTGVAIWGRY